MSNPNRQPQGTPTGGQFAPDPNGAQPAPVEIAPASQRALDAELHAVEASMKRAGELRAAVEVEEANAALCHIAIRARMVDSQAEEVQLGPCQCGDDSCTDLVVEQTLNGDGEEVVVPGFGMGSEQGTQAVRRLMEEGRLDSSIVSDNEDELYDLDDDPWADPPEYRVRINVASVIAKLEQADDEPV